MIQHIVAQIFHIYGCWNARSRTLNVGDLYLCHKSTLASWLELPDSLVYHIVTVYLSLHVYFICIFMHQFNSNKFAQPHSPRWWHPAANNAYTARVFVFIIQFRIANLWRPHTTFFIAPYLLHFGVVVGTGQQNWSAGSEFAFEHWFVIELWINVYGNIRTICVDNGIWISVLNVI